MRSGRLFDLETIGSAAFLTETNLRAIGKNLQRTYLPNDGPGFAELLAALDQGKRLRGDMS